jgi:hypothetical protein
MKAPTKLNFGHFLEAFPEIDLPVVLTEESAVAFSRENGPLSTHLVEQFLLPIEGEESIDELTEFVPCLRIPQTNAFFAVIYWRAELMSYQYVLATFLKNGDLIDRKVVAGTYSDGSLLLQSVATIGEDWIIYVVSGKTSANAKTYDASTSTSFSLEILPTGEIIRSED